MVFKMIRVQLNLPIQPILQFFLSFSPLNKWKVDLETAPYKLVIEWTSLFLGAVEKEQLVNRVWFDRRYPEGRDELFK